MKNNRENQHGAVALAALAFAGRWRGAALAAQAQNVDPVDHQLASRRAPKWSASSCREPLAAVPAGFAVQAPPRIALDLPGVSNALGTLDASRSTRATCAR